MSKFSWAMVAQIVALLVAVGTIVVLTVRFLTPTPTPAPTSKEPMEDRVPAPKTEPDSAIAALLAEMRAEREARRAAAIPVDDPTRANEISDLRKQLAELKAGVNTPPPPPPPTPPPPPPPPPRAEELNPTVAALLAGWQADREARERAEARAAQERAADRAGERGAVLPLIKALRPQPQPVAVTPFREWRPQQQAAPQTTYPPQGEEMVVLDGRFVSRASLSNPIPCTPERRAAPPPKEECEPRSEVRRPKNPFPGLPPLVITFVSGSTWGAPVFRPRPPPMWQPPPPRPRPCPPPPCPPRRRH